MRCDIADHQRVAIRHGACGSLRGNSATGTRLVVDEDRLSEHASKSFGDDPGDEVDAATRGLRRNDPDHPIRIAGLRRGQGADRDEPGNQQECQRVNLGRMSTFQCLLVGRAHDCRQAFDVTSPRHWGERSLWHTRCPVRKVMASHRSTFALWSRRRRSRHQQLDLRLEYRR